MLSELLSTAWWVLLLRGLLFIAFGLIALVWPGITLVSLTLVFAAFAFVEGCFQVAGATLGRVPRAHRWLPLLEGVCGIAFGALTFWAPAISALVLLMYIAAYAIVTGVLRVAMAIRLREEIEGEWLLGLSGLCGILLGALMLARPGVGALAVMVWIGAWGLVTGLALVVLAFRVRRFGRGAAGAGWRGGQPQPAR